MKFLCSTIFSSSLAIHKSDSIVTDVYISLKRDASYPEETVYHARNSEYIVKVRNVSHYGNSVEYQKIDIDSKCGFPKFFEGNSCMEKEMVVDTKKWTRYDSSQEKGHWAARTETELSQFLPFSNFTFQETTFQEVFNEESMIIRRTKPTLCSDSMNWMAKGSTLFTTGNRKKPLAVGQLRYSYEYEVAEEFKFASENIPTDPADEYETRLGRKFVVREFLRDGKLRFKKKMTTLLSSHSNLKNCFVLYGYGREYPLKDSYGREYPLTLFGMETEVSEGEKDRVREKLKEGKGRVVSKNVKTDQDVKTQSSSSDPEPGPVPLFVMESDGSPKENETKTRKEPFEEDKGETSENPYLIIDKDVETQSSSSDPNSEKSEKNWKAWIIAGFLSLTVFFGFIAYIIRKKSEYKTRESLSESETDDEKQEVWFTAERGRILV